MHLRLRTWKMWECFFFTSCIICVPTKISTRTDKDGFSPAVFRSRLEQSTPVTEWLVNCLRVLFSMAKSMVIMGSCVHFCLHNMLFLISLVNAPEFRCCRVISLANQKLTFDEIISCITRHDDFSPRSDRAVSLQTAPFLRDCKGRGRRRRTGQTKNEWVYSHLIQVNLK